MDWKVLLSKTIMRMLGNSQNYSKTEEVTGLLDFFFFLLSIIVLEQMFTALAQPRHIFSPVKLVF